jgi:hypothetical protein
MRNIHARDVVLGGLRPANDAQTQALVAAKAASEGLGESRVQTSFALAAPVSYPPMLAVVAWAVVLFCGFGLMSKGHTMSLVVVFISAGRGRLLAG